MKQIIVPIDQKAVEDLDYDTAKENQLIKWTLTNEEYKALEDLNVFNMLNDYCHCLIDEYEDASIAYIKLDTIKNKLQENKNEIVQQLYTLVAEALNRKTGIYFFF